MDSSRRERIGPTVLLLSLNVLSRQGTPSYMISMFRTKLVHSGTIAIFLRSTVMVCVVPLSYMIQTILTSSSMTLMMVSRLYNLFIPIYLTPVNVESTVITLADWYHTLAQSIVGVA